MCCACAALLAFSLILTFQLRIMEYNATIEIVINEQAKTIAEFHLANGNVKELLVNRS